jgi:hypothetical protein
VKRVKKIEIQREIPSLLRGEGGDRGEKIGSFLFPLFWRKPESSPAIGGIQPRSERGWTPVFTGMTTQKEFFHSFRGARGD